MAEYSYLWLDDYVKLFLKTLDIHKFLENLRLLWILVAMTIMSCKFNHITVHSRLMCLEHYPSPLAH